jgi:hypothetical protein
MQKYVEFLYISSDKSEKKINKVIIFIVSPKRIKSMVISLTKFKLVA